jgi:hypothetical protein
MATDANDNKTPDLLINEGQDGSATVTLPDDMAHDDEGQDQNLKAGGDVQDDDHGSDEDDAAAQQAEIEANGEVDPEQERIRAAKRAKRKARKEYHRQVSNEKDARLQNLQRQNQELLERISSLERKSASGELARLDKAIEEQAHRIEFAKRKIAEATAAGDGNLLTSAQEMWFEARRKAEDLEAYKQRMVQPERQQPIKQDPRIQRYASQWLESNPWYDPQGTDLDSKIALTVDQALAEEGWDPATPDYWKELDNRLSERLPNRYTDYSNEKPVQQRRPRSVVTGSGREVASSNSGGRNTFTLSPEQVKAIKEAGMWDNPETRNRMIKRYAMDARNRQGRN